MLSAHSVAPFLLEELKQECEYTSWIASHVPLNLKGFNTHGKATNCFAFRFFLPTFAVMLRPQLFTLNTIPLPLPALCVHTQLLSPVSHLDCKPQKESRSNTTAPLGTNKRVCICNHCHSGGQVFLILNFSSQNLHHHSLIPKLRLPDNTLFQRTKGKPTLQWSARTNRTALWYFASPCTID